jgi:hypothetical protein
MKIRTLGWVGVLLLAPALSLPADTAANKSKAGSRTTSSCKDCKETRPTLEPQLFAKGYDAEVKEGYEIARKIPATLDKLHCFCECAESPMFKHKTLLTCFVDKHAAGCGICLSEAKLAWQLKEKGVSDEEIVVTVESVHRLDGHPATH